jgi:transcriptional regulator with XRE-family HTH domain
MRRRPRQPAPESFVLLLQKLMAKQGISLNELARQAGLSPAFLSRILNKERGLPSDKAILRLASVLDLEPPERLLIEAGRIPEELRPAMRQPQMPTLLRATGKLSEEDFQEVIKAVQAVVLKLHRKKEPT